MAIDFGNIGRESTYENYSKKMMQNLIEFIQEDDSRRIKENNIDPAEYTLNENGKMTIRICPEPISFLKDITREETSQKKQQKFEKKISEFKEQEVYRPIGNRWINKTSNGVNIRLGNVDGDTGYQTPAVLGDNCVHGVVVGRTGAGKSVLINNIILNLITEYAPWELDLYLVDMKKVELSRYMTTTTDGSYLTPHVSACAATSEVRYVVSMIEYLANCMKARQSLFAALGVQKIKDFREKYCLVLPRILLLVDEFQQLFLEASGREKRILDECITAITKLGRATGVHLLFASQEMSGALGSKELANFKLRIALPCDEAISNAILGNSAASKIEEKGRTLVNTKGGSKAEDNIMYHTPFIDDKDEDGNGSEFSRYLGEIHETAKYCKFDKVQKFYQEDVQEKMVSIKRIKSNKKIRQQIERTLNGNYALVDVFVLGTGVLYNNAKYDFESVFLEKGKKRNIGIICTKDDYIANTLKTLSENFRYSTNKYEHTVIYESEVLKSVYSTLVSDISINDDGQNSNIAKEKSFLEFQGIRKRDIAMYNILRNLNYTLTINKVLGDFFTLYLRGVPKFEIDSLLQKYSTFGGDKAPIGKDNEILCKKFEEAYQKFIDSLGVEDNLYSIIKYMLDFFRIKANEHLKIVSALKGEVSNKKEHTDSVNSIAYYSIFFQLLRRYNYQDENEKGADIECGKYIDTLANSSQKKKYVGEKIQIRWIIGTDNIDKNEDKYLSSIMEDSTNHNEIFILAGANPENIERSYKCCNYIFLNSSDEKLYTKFKMNYTKKNDDNKAMDFKIINYNQERSYKQFYYEFEVKDAPRLSLEGFEE